MIYDLKFKGSNGKRKTISLFDRPDSPYTLQENDKGEMKSLRLLYLAEEDLLEHQFASKYLEGWDHWKRLLSCDWFKPYINQWREELEVIIRARALKQIMDEASDPANKGYMQALRYLMDKGHLDDVTKKRARGRPTKDRTSPIDLSRVERDMARVLSPQKKELN